jgi:hypothetical protein
MSSNATSSIRTSLEDAIRTAWASVCRRARFEIRSPATRSTRSAELPTSMSPRSRVSSGVAPRPRRVMSVRSATSACDEIMCVPGAKQSVVPEASAASAATTSAPGSTT